MASQPCVLLGSGPRALDDFSYALSFNKVKEIREYFKDAKISKLQQYA
jgi:hypothetical protein